MHLSMEQTQGDVGKDDLWEAIRAREEKSSDKAKVINKFLTFFLVYSSWSCRKKRLSCWR